MERPSLTAAELQAELKLAPVVASILSTRGLATLDEARRFLAPSLDDLHAPLLMRGMREAVERLQTAIAQHEKILIYGDYDVDGTMATVLLKTAIELLGGECGYHVPHRIQEGYGMRDEVIERAAAGGVRLVISVDTGIRAFAAAETAERCGLDLIVTDHHLPQAKGVPKALAVLNPNQEGCQYPCKELCGAGVAFKLAQAMLEAAGRSRLVPSFLKIAALATVADVVPLLGENRAIVSLGLEGLKDCRNAGLSALMKLSNLDAGQAPSSTDVAFRLAPRINAAGRMDVANDVVELLTVRDAARALELAQKLDALNAERRNEEDRIMTAIEAQIAADPSLAGAGCMVLAGEGWHRGVAGICASRVVERHARPALVISTEDGEAHGSGRSIPAFHLLAALESCPELFTRFGGHAHAVGFALPVENVPELRRRLDLYARERLTAEDYLPVLDYDAELALEDVTPELWENLRLLEPFGLGNPEPVFVARAATQDGVAKVLKEKHLKLRLRRGGDYGARSIEALGWRMARRLENEPLIPGSTLDAAFRIERNPRPEFGGGLQLILKDYRLVK